MGESSQSIFSVLYLNIRTLPYIKNYLGLTYYDY